MMARHIIGLHSKIHSNFITTMKNMAIQKGEMQSNYWWAPFLALLVTVSHKQ